MPNECQHGILLHANTILQKQWPSYVIPLVAHALGASGIRPGEKGTGSEAARATHTQKESAPGKNHLNLTRLLNQEGKLSKKNLASRFSIG
jgi:hypothetical protein